MKTYKKETVEEFLKRGGKITKLPPSIPVGTTHRSRSHTGNLYAAMLELHRGDILAAVRLVES